MPKRFYKHKLLLDENMPNKTQFPTLNERFDIKHIATDYKKSGLPDPAVYALAQKEKRFLVTYNVKDFKKLIGGSTDIGIIGISPNLPPKQIDKKLTSLLVQAKENELLGKITMLR